MFGIRAGDLIEISVDARHILLSKVEDRCVFCGTAVALVEFAGKRVCRSCQASLTDREPEDA